MEIIVIVLVLAVAFCFWLTLKIAVPLTRRKRIIKKSFRKIRTSISEGTRDEELIGNSKGHQYTAHGLAISFDNEATNNALEEIQAKGLARADEEMWFRCPISRNKLVKEGEILAKEVAIRSRDIGIKLVS